MHRRYLFALFGRRVATSTACLVCGGAAVAWFRSQRVLATTIASDVLTADAAIPPSFENDTNSSDASSLPSRYSIDVVDVERQQQVQVQQRRQIWKRFLEWFGRAGGFSQLDLEQQRLMDTIDFLWTLVRSGARAADLPPVQRKTPKSLKRCLEALAVLSRETTFCRTLLEDDKGLDCVLTALSFLKSLEVSFEEEHVLQEHLFLAELLANLSGHAAATQRLYDAAEVQRLLEEWRRSNSLKLQLYAVKTIHNLGVLRSDGESDSVVVYGTDIFPMQIFDCEEAVAKEYTTDVVFLNGLDGSVFHTWRQHDEIHVAERSSLWPRDWLSNDLPGLRLIGINVSAKAFLWSLWKEPQPVATGTRRTLTARASSYLQQLEQAGVGKHNRPVIWVTHSMGGLLVKDILRQSSLGNGELAAATRGVFFISVPHTGARALISLYSRPLRWLLTVEALELQKNSEPLQRLHEWFRDFVQQRNVNVVSLVETKTTHIHTWYYTLLNPEDSSDAEIGEVIGINMDHTYINKPRARDDEVYTLFMNFVLKCLGKSVSNNIDD